MMKVIPAPSETKMREKIQPGAFVGSTLITNAIRDTAMIFHGVSCCNTMQIHFRGDLIPNGVYIPVTATGIHEAEIVFGARDKLKSLLDDVASGKVFKTKPQCIWVTVGDGPSIGADDVKGISRLVFEESGVPVIYLEAPGYRGGASKGAELALCAILDELVKPHDGPKEGINIIAPFLMGSANWPFDIDWMLKLLEAADVKVNLVLSRNIQFSDLPKFSRAEANYLLTYEEMPEFVERSNALGVETWSEPLVLPYGVANTEEWYLSIAKRFGNVEKAKEQMRREMEEVRGVLYQNYNFSWMAGLLSEKRAAVCGLAPFATAIARYLFYDLNIRPRVVGIWGETEQSFKTAEKLLEPIGEYIDLVVLEDPTYYELGQEVKKADVDFVISSIQDKPLFEGLGIPHLCLSGYYFFNNFNFVPWPLAGIKGTLRLFSEMCNLAEKAFYETEAWKKLAYKPRMEAEQTDSSRMTTV